MENAPNKQKGGSEIYMPQNVYLYNPGVPVPKNVQHVEIPEGITLIPKKAFEGCKDLQSVVISDSVTKIEKSAFKFCSALQSLMYKGVNIAPFINIDGYGGNTFDIIRFLSQLPADKSAGLSKHTLR